MLTCSYVLLVSENVDTLVILKIVLKKKHVHHKNAETPAATTFHGPELLGRAYSLFFLGHVRC